VLDPARRNKHRAVVWKQTRSHLQLEKVVEISRICEDCALCDMHPQLTGDMI
jgi:hypothetical protein